MSWCGRTRSPGPASLIAPTDATARMALAPASRSQGHSDRKSTRLNSSHLVISYAVFCLKKKKHKLTFSMPLSHCIPQSVNISPFPRLDTLGFQQSYPRVLNAFLFGLIILVANFLQMTLS